MQFSDMVPFETQPTFSPLSNYIAYFHKDNIYVKHASVDIKNIIIIPYRSKASNTAGSKKSLKMAFSPDQTHLAVLSNATRIEVYGILDSNDSTAKLKSRIQDSLNEIESMLWAPDSTQILTFNQHPHKCQIYNLSLGSISEIRKIKIPSPEGCAFFGCNNGNLAKSQSSQQQVGSSSPKGLFMAILQKHDRKDSIGIYYTPEWKLINHIALESSFDAVKIEFMCGGTLAVYENPINFRVYFVDCSVGPRQTYSPSEYALGAKTTKVSANEMFLAIGAFDQSVHLVNAKTCKLISKLDCSSPSVDCAKTKLYRETSPHDHLQEYTQGLEKLKALKEKPQSPFSVVQIEFLDECKYLAAKNDMMPESVFIWNLETLEIEAIISLLNPIREFKWIKGVGLCINSGSPTLLFWKGEFVEEAQVPKGLPEVGRLEVGNQGRLLLSARKTQKKFCFASILG